LNDSQRSPKRKLGFGDSRDTLVFMKLPVLFNRILPALITAAALLGTGAHAQLAVQKNLAQIDRTFVCPEDLPSDEARSTAVELFLQQLASIQPSITINEIAAYRTSLLQKHQCRQTLAHIATPAPPSASTSHWARAGRVVNGGSGVTITVDVASMVGAGPARMRTWIKYRNDKADAQGVQETLAYEQLDCARSYHSTMSLYRYGSDGHIVSSDLSSGDDEEPIIPDSVLAGIVPFTCAAHGLKAR
jgi:hypothetical protein